MDRAELRTLRIAVANYIGSEGCSCCQGPTHAEDKERLAKLLHVDKYDDGSGYDFYKYIDRKGRD